MLPALPGRQLLLRTLHCVALATLSVLAAREAHALDVALGEPRAHGEFVSVEARLSDLFAEPVEKSLERGMPATLQVHAELWRRRAVWFDRLEHTYEASVRIRYEVWNDAFRIERAGAPALTLSGLDSVRVALERPTSLPVGRLDDLAEDAHYYIVVTATIAPLSVEDVREVEGWLSGEVETQRNSGFGVFTELPRSLFDTVRNFTGFGDRHARARSRLFTSSELEVVP